MSDTPIFDALVDLLDHPSDYEAIARQEVTGDDDFSDLVEIDEADEEFPLDEVSPKPKPPAGKNGVVKYSTKSS